MKYYVKKEGNLVICDNMDKPWGHYTNWNMPETEGHILYRFHLYEESQIV